VVTNEDIDGVTLLALTDGALHDFHFSNMAKEKVLAFTKHYNEQKTVCVCECFKFLC
jgi:hypothetical protein